MSAATRHHNPKDRDARSGTTSAVPPSSRPAPPPNCRSVRPPGYVRRPSGQASNRPSGHRPAPRSEEHTSELQSLMRISYAVFCLKKKKHLKTYIYHIPYITHYTTAHTTNDTHIHITDITSSK